MPRVSIQQVTEKAKMSPPWYLPMVLSLRDPSRDSADYYELADSAILQIKEALAGKSAPPAAIATLPPYRSRSLSPFRHSIDLLLKQHQADQGFNSANFCYWSIGDGPHAFMVQGLVHSARQLGVKTDFHAYCDRTIFGAATHPCGEFDKKNYLFKLEFLRHRLKKLDYDYFVFLDADSFFVRHPGDFLGRLIGHDRIFVQMENRCDSPRVRRNDWWSLKLDQYITLVKALSTSPPQAVFNCNGGFFVVRRDSIDLFCDLCMVAWNAAKEVYGVEITEEIPMAVAGHILQASPADRTLRNTSHIWATDWTSQFFSGVPDADPWVFEDYMTGEKYPVNPAIIHSMKIDQHFVQYGERIWREAAAKSPLERARKKLAMRRILAPDSLIAARQAVCDGCDRVKIEAGKFEGCLECGCSVSEIKHKMKTLAIGHGCPLNKWPLFILREHENPVAAVPAAMQ